MCYYQPVGCYRIKALLIHINYTSGDYLMLYKSLANCDWTCVYNQTSVHLAVDSLNAAVNESIAQAIPVSHAHTNEPLTYEVFTDCLSFNSM